MSSLQPLSRFSESTGPQLRRDDLRNQSQDSRSRRSRDQEALHQWTGQTWQQRPQGLRLSIQRCKANADFFDCIKNHTSDASRLTRAAREHAREIRTLSLTPHHLENDRLERLGQTIKTVLGPRSILWSNHSKTLGCKGRSLYGYYNIPRGFVVMCQGFHRDDLTELIDTLKHEGWHAVQHQCRKGKPLLSEQQIATRIRREDAFNVHGYHPKQQRLESEARVIAKMEDQAWIRLVRQQCRGKNKTLQRPDIGVPYTPF